MYIMCDPPRIYLSLPEYTPLFNNYMRPSQNIPFPLKIYPPFQHKYMCDPPRICPSLPPRIHSPFQQLNATFPESTPLSTAIILCDAPRIYPSLPEYTPPPFQQLFITLSESTPPSQNIPTFQQPYYYTTLPESIPPSISPRIYPPPFQQLYATLTEITPPFREYPPFLDNYMPPSLSEYIPPHLSTTICDIPRIYPSVTEYAPFSRHFCNCERVYHLLPELKNILGGRGRFWAGRIIL